MRVIKENNEEKIHECEYCNSIIAYKAEDISHLFYDTILCPVCNSHTRISIFDKKIK